MKWCSLPLLFMLQAASLFDEVIGLITEKECESFWKEVRDHWMLDGGKRHFIGLIDNPCPGFLTIETIKTEKKSGWFGGSYKRSQNKAIHKKRPTEMLTYWTSKEKVISLLPPPPEENCDFLWKKATGSYFTSKRTELFYISKMKEKCPDQITEERDDKWGIAKSSYKITYTYTKDGKKDEYVSYMV